MSNQTKNDQGSTVIPKSSLEQIQVGISSFRDHDYVDVRTHFKADDGEWRPTKKGITLPQDRLPELIAALEKLLPGRAPTD